MSTERLRSFAPAILVGVLGFMLTLDLRIQQTPEVVGRRAELAEIAASRQQRTAELEQRLAELRDRFAQIAARSGGAELKAIRNRLDELSAAAGLTAATGRGLLVRLADATDQERGLHDADTRIQDVDLQAVVNELWAGGAEAVAINGQRIVSTTAIRNAGGAVLVNFRVLASPYRVVALGPRAMEEHFEASEVVRRFNAWTEIYGLGFSTEARDGLEVPPFTGSLRFTRARPVDSAG